MISFTLQLISGFILLVIQRVSYVGIFLLMTVQSVNIPIPSEIIMPFSGFLVQKNIFDFWIVVFVGASGNLTGSLLSYYLAHEFLKEGWEYKNSFLRLLVNPQSLKMGEEWFKKYGASSIFVGRLIPVVSTFISFPAGLARMKITDFSILTFLGSLVWSAFLTWVGFALGENWTILRLYFEKFDYLILFLIGAAAIVWCWHRLSLGKVRSNLNKS